MILSGFKKWLLLFSVTLSAGPPVVPVSVQSNIRERVDYGYTPGLIVGLVNAEGRACFSYGRASFEREMPLNEDSLFEIGSVTKVFTATLLAEMVGRGEVELGQTVASLLPSELPVPSRDNIEISLLHLAIHTSALPTNPDNLDRADFANPFADYGADRLYDFLRTHRLRRHPGAVYEYSNIRAFNSPLKGTRAVVTSSKRQPI
ncbi:MAG: beta-lactamase family protein [Verrucomicrobia bacterium]|nr:beta-lactamase family protein [Verrucomicrobiota bacterium]